MRWFCIAGALAAGGLLGCGGGGGGAGGGGKPQPMNGQVFFNPSADPTPHSQVDEADPIQYNNVNMDLLKPEGEQPAPSGESVRSVSPIVREANRKQDDDDEASPTTLPATRPVAANVQPGNGGFQTVGAVIAEVNGKPIYADRILKELEPELASKAAALTPDQFRELAAREIDQQVQEAISDELVFAAAQRKLDMRERSLADSFTEKWRNDQIIEAGGSLELARTRALEQGQTFEQLVDEQYRMNMRDIYRQRKVYPRIQVTPDDIRRYYDRNVDKEFTERSKIQFRLIKIEVKKIGPNREDSITRITEIREKAIAGDFAEVASAENHDEKLKKDGGNVGFIERGSFRIEEVEERVWDTPEGEVTDIIETQDAFYIAKVEQKENGRVRAFEEPIVQAAIANRLRSEQFEVLLAAERATLRDQAVVNYDPKTMLQPAIEMAMQNYPRWAAAQ